MSSKSKKKDSKKSKKQNDKIELTEIAEETVSSPPAAAKRTSSKTSPEPSAPIENAACKVKVIPAPAGQTDKKYEETTAAALNSAAGEGYKLVCVLPSSDSKKLIAFFRSSDKDKK